MFLYGSIKKNFEIVGETSPQTCPNCGKTLSQLRLISKQRQLRLISKHNVSLFG